MKSDKWVSGWKRTGCGKRSELRLRLPAGLVSEGGGKIGLDPDEAAQGVQAWSRYTYVNNAPVSYSDPSGHMIPPCPLCSIWNKFYDSVMQTIGRTYVYENNQADSLGDLMVLAYFQEPSATITGGAQNDIANDNNLLDRQNGYAERIVTDSRYGNEEFSVDFGTSPLTFGEMGNNNMFEDATHSQTWTVRAANVSTSVDVTMAGDMYFNYSLSDTLDLRPDWWSGARTGVSGFGYNVVTTITGAIWHGILGARDIETQADWTNEVKAN